MQNTLNKLFLCTALCASLFMGAARAGAQQQNEGTAAGILTGKSDAWIEVKADGERQSRRLMPRWIGALPQRGGGLDREMLATFQTLVVGNRVRLLWLQDEQLRVVKIEMVLPRSRSGEATGRIVDKGNNWIDVETGGGYEDAEAITERYMPQWVGGMPEDGGGLDKEMSAKLAKLSIGDNVELKWVYDERKRVTEITKAGEAEKAAEPEAPRE
ncbi:MAG TPA: hypothetical protein VF719_05440 [Abditibacteriaceae bacterium]